MSYQLTLRDVLHAHRGDLLKKYGEKLPGYQKRGLWLLEHCQSVALGGHIRRCSACGQQEYRHNSCRYRGCPQCEGSKEAKWLLEREDELLPVHYFHVVFTVPHVLNELFYHNQRECYGALFEAAAKTLNTVGKNRIGAKLGFFSLLHTWGQLLNYHPHLHCVIPGGGISLDNEQWVSTSKKRRYFASTKVLAEVFRGILLKKLRQRYLAGKLNVRGDFEQLLDDAARRRWVVHAKPPFGSPLAVLKYLSRYTRKVAISNSRLLELKDGMLSFKFKDYANASIGKTCRMSAVEFLRRFAMHLPPPGFVRIRYYGFMAGAKRKARLKQMAELIRGLLPELPKRESSNNSSCQARCCTRCGKPALKLLIVFSGPMYRDSS
jgi:hypothetical protein